MGFPTQLLLENEYKRIRINTKKARKSTHNQHLNRARRNQEEQKGLVVG